MTVCSHCNSTNPDDASFCNYCGASLTFEETPIEPVVTRLDQNQPQPPVFTPNQLTAYSYKSAQPSKDRSIALILEILPGIFGFLGFGWIYSGNTTTGLLWLIFFLLWVVVSFILVLITGGLAAICTLPIHITCVALSSISLNNYAKNHPEIFG